MTEYLYDRDNPKSHLRQRINGAQGFAFGVPNIYERADMVGRALAKETEGDFNKMVSSMNKPRDMAQKWRAFKNIARFFKNPMAYTYWKFQPLHSQNRVRIIWALLWFHLYSSFVAFVFIRNKKENMMAHWRYSLGEMNKAHLPIHNDQRMPADHKKNYVRYSNFHQVRRNKKLSMIWLNWWCRDQSFRKYFELRKRHDIRPSLSGFAHEEIYDNVAKKNAEIHAMRASRTAA